MKKGKTMKILIFTASAGNGHNSTAKRLREKILKHDSNAEVKIVDTYKSYASKLKAWTMDRGYCLTCNYLLPVYNYFFKKAEKASEANKKKRLKKKVKSLPSGMLREIYDFQPDLIISTYIFNTVALAELKKRFTIPAKVMCMTLDYGISPYWEKGAEVLDYMFLTDDYMIEPFLKKGYKKEQLISSGIPVADQFSSPLDREEASKAVGLDPNMFTVVIMKASFFPVSNQKIINELKKVEKPLQVVVVNGKDKKVAEDFAKRLKKANLHHKVINLGFTNQIVEYFSVADLVIGKGGGLSTTETINAGVPSLILNKLPQQEVYNKKHLIDNGCAIATTKNELAKHLNFLLDNPDEYKKLKENTLKLRKTETLNMMYEIIKAVPKADYSNIENQKITKREIRRKLKLNI